MVPLKNKNIISCSLQKHQQLVGYFSALQNWWLWPQEIKNYKVSCSQNVIQVCDQNLILEYKKKKIATNIYKRPFSYNSRIIKILWTAILYNETIES